MESTELLKQNLAIEADLRRFVGFVLESVTTLGGNPFAATIAALSLMQKLRDLGSGTGQPLIATLWLKGEELLVECGSENDKVCISSQVRHFSNLEIIATLKQHLTNSTEQADPALLIQRNLEMTRYLDETRERTEKELEALQQSLEKRQNELQDSIHNAETDALTGLLNRRAYDDKLGQAFHYVLRQKNTALSLILFDLDYFKQINDEFGHQYGDTYLIKMANCMRSVIRQEVDFAFRFGGDEFAIIIYAAHTFASKKAEQVLAMMDNKVSIGISAIDQTTPSNLTLEEFIHRADDALYEAKHQGRGRVVVDEYSRQLSGSYDTPEK